MNDPKKQPEDNHCVNDILNECFDNVFDPDPRTKRNVELLLVEEQETDAIEQNFQCGLCGKIFNQQKEAQTHVESHDEEEDTCYMCVTYEKEEAKLKAEATEKEEQIKLL